MLIYTLVLILSGHHFQNYFVKKNLYLKNKKNLCIYSETIYELLHINLIMIEDNNNNNLLANKKVQENHNFMFLLETNFSK